VAWSRASCCCATGGSRAIARLSDGYAEDLLDLQELERRLDLAHGAKTVAELDALIADLAVPEPAAKTTALAVLGVTTIDVSVLMGNVEVILPPGLAIDVTRLPGETARDVRRRERQGRRLPDGVKMALPPG